MVEGGDGSEALLAPVDGDIARICHQRSQHARIDDARIMRAVIGPLLALGQR
jgi:hypothetical protein